MLPRQLFLPVDEPMRPAAVLIAMIEDADSERLLLTRRADALKHHAGQVSFPGGGVEPGDDSIAGTALREAREEVGLDPADVALLGELPAFNTVTGFEVTPVVGRLARSPDYSLDPVEVADVFEVPLAFLFDERNCTIGQRLWGGVPVPSYEWHFDGQRIWGATGWMIQALIKLIENE